MSMCCWVISLFAIGPICSFRLSFAVNSGLNRSFFLHLYLQFYYISVAVNWYIHGTWYGVRDTHNFLGAPVAQPAPTKFGTKVVIVTYSPNRSCVPILKLLASIAERSRGPKFFQCFLAQTPARFGRKSCFLTSSSPSLSFIPNLKLLALTVAEINRVSQQFLDAPLAWPPANFHRKSCFSASYSPNPSCIPNLKLLASTVAEINRGPKFLHAPLAQTPINFGPESCLW